MSFKKTLLFSIVGLLVLILLALFLGEKMNLTNQKETNLQLYWFIPDGVRADPDVFTIFKWAAKKCAHRVHFFAAHIIQYKTLM